MKSKIGQMKDSQVHDSLYLQWTTKQEQAWRLVSDELKEEFCNSFDWVPDPTYIPNTINVKQSLFWKKKLDELITSKQTELFSILDEKFKTSQIAPSQLLDKTLVHFLKNQKIIQIFSLFSIKLTPQNLAKCILTPDTIRQICANLDLLQKYAVDQENQVAQDNSKDIKETETTKEIKYKNTNGKAFFEEIKTISFDEKIKILQYLGIFSPKYLRTIIGNYEILPQHIEPLSNYFVNLENENGVYKKTKQNSRGDVSSTTTVRNIDYKIIDSIIGNNQNILINF